MFANCKGGSGLLLPHRRGCSKLTHHSLFPCPGLVGEFIAGKTRSPWLSVPSGAATPVPIYFMAHVVLLAGGRAFSSGIGLTHLLFLFRASGTPHFSPTGKYKADGVLETVRLSGKLSCHLWLCLGTISFHISKSSPSWGWLAIPAAQAPRILPFGGWGELSGLVACQSWFSG